MMWRLGGLLLSILALSALSGCGDSQKTPTVVKGTALYRGTPIAGGMIVFAPNADRGSSGPLLVGTIQDDGSYAVTAADDKPIQSGWYRVSIAPPPGVYEVPTAEFPYPGPPQKYRNPAKSGLDREVRSAQENVYHFDLDDE